MTVKNSLNNSLPLAEAIGSNPQLLRVSPSILRFLSAYMSKFRIRRVGDGHLPISV